MKESQPIDAARKRLAGMVLLAAWIGVFAWPARAAAEPAAEAMRTLPPSTPAATVPDTKAQSGAAAADEARIFTAQLRHCEELPGAQREACVERARKRLGQM